MFRKSIALVIATFFYCLLLAQQPADSLIQNFKYHIYYLADDSLEGRATGTKGERIAMDYIRDVFRKEELKPKGSNGYLQPFDFVSGREYGENNELTINGKSLELEKDYYPLVYSANKDISAPCVNVGFGIDAPGLKHNDYKRKKNLDGKIFIIDISSPEGNNPHSDFYQYIDPKSKIDKAIEKGAAGIIFINTKEDVDDPEPKFKRNIFPSEIPVVFLKEHVWNSLKKEKKLQAQLSVELIKIEKTGHNVLGYIDNGSSETVVIGAHYDHLGWGESGGSLYRGEPAIHNGADDNASGIAMMIELSKWLLHSSLTNNNYLFIAFSGEELGLFGSSYFANHPTISLENINYMINFDMVGRLDPVDKNLQINGYGTSNSWQEILPKIHVDSIQVKTSESGIGPSDHTSFYLKDIPVLHFFTGAHEDYHKPTDDPEFINFGGMVSVIKFAYALIDSLNDEGRLDFVKVKEDTTSKAPRFTVTLGVIPNYMFEGEGVKIDGVTEGKTASKAGILAGDIVIAMGEHKITDLMSYMQALSEFKKGDQTVVKVLRDDKTLEFQVTFQ